MKKFLSRLLKKFLHEEPTVNYSASSLGLKETQVAEVAALFVAAESILGSLELHQASMIYGLLVKQGMEKAGLKSLNVEIPGIVKLSATTEGRPGIAADVFKSQSIDEQMYPFSKN